VPSSPPAAESAPAAGPARTAAAAAAPPAPLSPGWQSALAAWLEAHKTYPEQARRRGDQGRAVVRFTVDRAGLVQDVEILTSSGSTVLDGAIDRMLSGAHVPPFPPGMTQADVTVTVQIRYALE
jgi:protein TonB